MIADADELIATAAHESAHCVFLLHFDCRFEAVRIWRNADGEILGQVTKPSGTRDPIAAAMCALSGPVAELAVSGVPLEAQAGIDDDVAFARECLAHADSSGDLDVDSVLPFVSLLVEDCWPAIELIAAQLIVRRTLSYEDIVALATD